MYLMHKKNKKTKIFYLKLDEWMLLLKDFNIKLESKH